MYQIENPIGKAMSGMSGAAGTYGSMMKDIPANRKPGSTVGGGVMAGMGGAAMGAQVGKLMATPAALKAGGLAAVGGPAALGVGALLGIGAYLLS
jgi:hypothetical protein